MPRLVRKTWSRNEGKAIGRLAAAALLVVTVGCQSMSDVLEARSAGEGTSEVYDASVEEAWDVSRTVFRWNGADAIEEHPREGYMLTSTSMGLFTYGTVMGAWIEDLSPSRTRVTAITKRRVATNLVTDLTESGFHDDFRFALSLVREGKPLPLTPPRKDEDEEPSRRSAPLGS